MIGQSMEYGSELNTDGINVSKILSPVLLFLPPAYVVRRKGNLFTGVCLSTGGGGLRWGGPSGPVR